MAAVLNGIAEISHIVKNIRYGLMTPPIRNFPVDFTAVLFCAVISRVGNSFVR